MEINLKIKYIPVNRIIVNLVNKHDKYDILCNIGSAKPPMMPNNEVSGTLFIHEINFCKYEKYQPKIARPTRYGDDTFDVINLSSSYIHSTLAKWLKQNFMNGEEIHVKTSAKFEIEYPERAMDLAEAYDKIGGSPTDSDNVLKEKFRKRVKELHPDLNGGDAKQMAEINDAWRMIQEARE